MYSFVELCGSKCLTGPIFHYLGAISESEGILHLQDLLSVHHVSVDIEVAMACVYHIPGPDEEESHNDMHWS